jgi:DnaJ-domain-containing protein 1
MNADEAQKCLAIAKRAINERNWDKAEKFLVKSIKLEETSEA